MHKATCAECNKECEVPFRPSGDKPVYCSNCFGRREDSGGNRFERKPSNRQDSGEKRMFEAICDKCRSECEVPFRPTGNKPVFCDDCFADGGRSGNINKATKPDSHGKQFEMLSNKLDKIINLLSEKTSAPKAVKDPAKSVARKSAVKEVKKTVKKKTVDKKAVTSKKAVKKVAVKKPVAKKKAIKSSYAKASAGKKKK